MNKPISPWQRMMKLLHVERKDINQIFYYSIFSGVVALSLPLGIQSIVNLIQGAQITTSWIVLVTLVTLGVMFTGILQLMQLRIIETLQQRIFTKSSFELSYRFPKISMQELRKYYPPELANRFFDTLTIQKGLAKILVDMPATVLQVVFSLILLSFYHPFFIMFGIILLTAIFILFQYTARKGVETSLEESKYKYKVAHWIQEVARSVVSFKASGSSNLALQKNDKLVMNYLNAREKHFKIIRLQYIKMVGFKAIITAGLLIIGGVLVLQQKMNIGQFVAAEIIILLIISSVEKLIVSLETLYDILTSLEKLGQVVDKSLESQTGENPNFEQGMNLRLESLSYKVPEKSKPILQAINCEIPQGKHIVLRGESGSGKTTFLRILAGLLPPTDGLFLVNEMNHSSINVNHYRSHIGLSLDEEMPFEGSLRENVSFGDPFITDDQIFEVLRELGLMSFFNELPDGLQSTLYPEGKQMSFTTAKKIILARAILKKPKILILEQALSLNNEEDTKRMIDYLTDPKHSWTLVVVSSNNYWVQKCDEVITLEQGEIKEKQEYYA